uniref:IrrE N-terminal-like domain-containing protein n=1 Tax=Candidatus Kentrum sp. TUN TaxID=2126343 RepID=A0A451AN05_9GAMM|nr:MAG: protein of unknown function (DUF955) [Candidatus Kentron sp. TUN]VFK64614.1 MAG: protein of unknown function (DUF955) [Candidatus Kentron sp. TUN]VFK67389.1 MAG: protein of unknown function (DUF955) [Candidatus Kentron sp. TUN]
MLPKDPRDLVRIMKDEGVIKGLPIDIDAIASKLGITIEHDHSMSSSRIIGEISFNNETPIIRINPKQNDYEPRRRFTVAHEIGHYCLHSSETRMTFKDSKDSMSRTKSYTDKFEREANDFAAGLLMPVSYINETAKDLAKKYKQSTLGKRRLIDAIIWDMANEFNVSNVAMSYRLQKLGVIPK